MDIKLDTTFLKGFVSEEDLQVLIPNVDEAHASLENRSGLGNDFLGWIDLPERITEESIDEITVFGEEVRSRSDCLISIGIGGSYAGIHSSLEFLIADQKIPVYYAGHNLSSGYLYHLLNTLKHNDVTVLVISKSGTTTEPALAFRIIREWMKHKYNETELKKRIVCITDKDKGALRGIAAQEGYKTYPIANDVGGRFSVLTPVGLVPLAIAGIDIRSLVHGAQIAQRECSKKGIENNMAYKYAAARFALYNQGKMIEVLSSFYQRFTVFEEWWKQLFGESEGKQGKGIFPASLSFTADLHSMGQLLQEGERNMFETFLITEDSGHELIIPHSEDDADNFNCVAGKDLDYVNKQAYRATAEAHFEGGVPNMSISVPRFDAPSLGQLYYFFERTVAMTGYLMGVNPFNQPGVEAYKTKMFHLLGRTSK